MSEIPDIPRPPEGQREIENFLTPEEILAEHFPASLAIIKARKKEALELAKIVIHDAKAYGLDQRQPVYEALAQVRRAEDEMVVIADRLRGWLDHPRGYRFVAVDGPDDGRCAAHG